MFSFLWECEGRAHRGPSKHLFFGKGGAHAPLPFGENGRVWVGVRVRGRPGCGWRAPDSCAPDAALSDHKNARQGRV